MLLKSGLDGAKFITPIWLDIDVLLKSHLSKNEGGLLNNRSSLAEALGAT